MEYYDYKVRLLDGTVQYLMTKNNTLAGGDIIKFVTAINRKLYRIGIVESRCAENAACRFAKASKAIGNISNLNDFEKIKNCPYYISHVPVDIGEIDADFRAKHMSIPERVSLEVGFDYEDETPEMLKGYRRFSEGEVLAFLYSEPANRCIALVANNDCGGGIEEIHFILTCDMNARQIASSTGCRRVSETVFAALTFALAVDFKDGSFVAINSELFDKLKSGECKDPDNTDSDDFDAISVIFSRRMSYA